MQTGPCDRILVVLKYPAPPQQCPATDGRASRSRAMDGASAAVASTFDSRKRDTLAPLNPITQSPFASPALCLTYTSSKQK